MDFIALAEDIQRRARKVIEQSKVVEIWQKHGAEIHLVGSMANGLLMKHRDIDFHIYTPDFKIAKSFAAMAELAENLRVKKVTYANLSDAKDGCLEWHAWFEDDQGELWQLDMMHIIKGSEYDGFFEHVAERIKETITSAEKEAVLRLKYETPEDVKIAGIEYYKAVMSGGVRDFSSFMKWREENPLIGIEKWTP